MTDMNVQKANEKKKIGGGGVKIWLSKKLFQ